jgi:hypothetical protein
MVRRTSNASAAEPRREIAIEASAALQAPVFLASVDPTDGTLLESAE